MKDDSVNGRAFLRACQAARFYSGFSKVQGVYLFGSVARGEATPKSDIDLLLVTDQHTAGAFLCGLSQDAVKRGRDVWFVYRRLHNGWPTGANALSLSSFTFPGVDITVVGEGWQHESYISEIQLTFRHIDPNLMQNIKRDAIRLDPSAGQFLQPGE